jgi:hypothetical protein
MLRIHKISHYSNCLYYVAYLMKQRIRRQFSPKVVIYFFSPMMVVRPKYVAMYIYK